MQKNNTFSRFCSFAIIVGLGALPSLAAAEDISSAITGGKVKASVRYRSEFVSEDANPKGAKASTVRSRLGYGTAPFHKTGVYMEIENVTAVFGSEYKPTPTSSSPYSVVADPEDTEVNQAYVEFAAIPATDVKLGRQRIILDNARWVGNVGWRQNEQTYDAVMLVSEPLPKAKFSYAYLDKVNTIFAGVDAMSSHLINVSYGGLPWASFSAYAYLLDYDTKADSKSLGLRLKGAQKVFGNASVTYAAEFAQQSQYADRADFSQNYFLGEFGGTAKGIAAAIGYEMLGGDGTTSLQTPLATKHAFNGWVDKFLATPANGLTDLFLRVGGTLGGVKLLGVYHSFSADNGGAKYGSEIDFMAAKKFAKMYTTGLKFGSYSADTFSSDTTKTWVFGEIAF